MCGKLHLPIEAKHQQYYYGKVQKIGFHCTIGVFIGHNGCTVLQYIFFFLLHFINEFILCLMNEFASNECIFHGTTTIEFEMINI